MDLVGTFTHNANSVTAVSKSAKLFPKVAAEVGVFCLNREDD